MGGHKQDQGKIRDVRLKAKFLHELEHIKQNQNGEWVTFKAGALQAAGRIKGFFKALFTAAFSDKTFGQIYKKTRDDYIYHGYASEPTKSFSEYNVEQRGQIVEDYSRTVMHGVTSGPKEHKAEAIIKADPDVLEE